MAITVGLDFGTHQTKICYETVERGTVFHEVLQFRSSHGEMSLTLPSVVRLCADGRLRYGQDAVDAAGGRVMTYFKQIMFSWSAELETRTCAEEWSVLYLAFVVLNLDRRFGTSRYIVHMGMPTDADPSHYAFCKWQAVKVLAAAMKLARDVFGGNQNGFLDASFSDLSKWVKKCMAEVPRDIHEAQKKFPILVFPEAYAALLPLVINRKLPPVGPNLFVDIGGGTVDISLFTNRMVGGADQYRPVLYYYHSIPLGLNRIVGIDPARCHDVSVRASQITPGCITRFRSGLLAAIDEIVDVLKRKYEDMGRTNVMPFANLCGQVLDGRPICYSGGGSLFRGLKLPAVGTRYAFSQVTTVSGLINHAKLAVGDDMFPVLATAFSLSQGALRQRSGTPDEIRLATLDSLFGGIRLPQETRFAQGGVHRRRTW